MFQAPPGVQAPSGFGSGFPQQPLGPQGPTSALTSSQSIEAHSCSLCNFMFSRCGLGIGQEVRHILLGLSGGHHGALTSWYSSQEHLDRPGAVTEMGWHGSEMLNALQCPGVTWHPALAEKYWSRDIWEGLTKGLMRTDPEDTGQCHECVAHFHSVRVSA